MTQQTSSKPTGRDTIVDRMLHNAAARGSKPAIWHRNEGTWHALTWQGYTQRARAFAGALLARGYQPGWGVAILANNRVEWFIADVGALFARAVPTGVYPTLTGDQAAYVIDHCEARVVVVEDKEQWAKVDAERGRLPHLQTIVVMTGAGTIDDPTAIGFAEFLASGSGHTAAVDARIAEIDPTDLATLIYTSGTTGHPKGVMLSHDNLAFTARNAVEMLGGVSEEDCLVSYLPLSHIAEQMLSLHLSITAGYPIWVAERLELLKETLLAARPTFFLGVPRVWEKFKAALESQLGAATGAKGAIVRWSRGVGAKAAPTLLEKGPPTGLLGLQYAAADKLFFSKLKARLGMDRLKLPVSGAAPIGKDVLDFFASIGLLIHEVYGQSEDSGPTTFNQPFPGKRRLGTVGLPLPGTEVRLAEDGEILVRGRHVFMGYLKNPEATAEALVDGWLHSGDVGERDREGFLRITDRKKDLLITAGGKNVAPQNLEKLLKAIPGIGQAVVLGDKRKYLAALLTLDAEAAPALAAERGWPTDPATLARHPAFVAHVEAGLNTANGGLARYEQIKKWALLPVDFSVEGGELTPTQKVRRKVVNEKYAARIAELYPEG